jgi:aryl-alcohol dehydrogenase-like predicted oxidoreductase
MRFRTLGGSGCSVSVLALGTMTFGSETDEAGSHAQLDRFFEVGGNLIDTADVYSGTESESTIGRWLGKQGPDIRERAVIATTGPMTAGSPAGTCCERSMPPSIASGSNASTSTKFTLTTR